MDYIVCFIHCFLFTLSRLRFSSAQEEGWQTKDGFEYYFSGAEDTVSASDARQRCQERGANILSIADMDESTFIGNQLTTGFWFGLFANNACGDCQDDNDGTDCIRCRNSWRWHDDTQYGYQNWQNNKPDQDPLSTCARLFSNGQWRNNGCSGWYRYICKRAVPDVNECTDNMLCNKRGQCINTPGSYRCDCYDGWQGQHCDDDINECQNGVVCENGGVCKNRRGNYFCRCEAGYTGSHCETDVDECTDSLHSCVHGSCINAIGSYQCRCSSGWTGIDCDNDIDECQSDDLCKNGGTCTNTRGSYNCSCATGYTGVNCSAEVEECKPDPCLYGECTDLFADYSCSCIPGYTGRNCESDIDECSDEKKNKYCENGDCTNLNGSYTCSCFDGYFGKNCANFKQPPNDNTALEISLYVGATGFAISFIVMMIMLVLDRRDVKARKQNVESQSRKVAETMAQQEGTSSSNDKANVEPSTSAAYANVSSTPKHTAKPTVGPKPGNAGISVNDLKISMEARRARQKETPAM